ncbi:hypothetical protein MMC11_004050 [Xylographa trunciseda]|nr:hypothetical protein [Xylographa trunciseda]
MAGMEQLEIHSKSYLVRWVNVKGGHTISWSIQPHKKPINFGIFKHPGSGAAPTPRLPSTTYDAPPTPGLQPVDTTLETPQPQAASLAVIEKLKGIGLKLIDWHGTCEANQVTSGEYNVPDSEGGMYALVFDNTFAKSFAKQATFVLLTYPTDSAPQSNHQIHHFQGTSSGSLPSTRPRSKSKLKIEKRGSSDSIPRPGSSINQVDGPSAQVPSRVDHYSDSSTNSAFFTGILQKRRRKRHQGYARRFFSLDFTSSTLSYYHNRNTLALRGAVPLSLAAIGANGTTREISIDSGAEVWHLRAPNQKEFEAWKNALEAASKSSNNKPSLPNGLGVAPVTHSRSKPQLIVEEEREWFRLQSLVEKVAVSRDTARRLAKDTDPKYLSLSTSSSIAGSSTDLSRTQELPSVEGSPVENPINDEYFQNGERRPFWKRKVSSARATPGIFKRSVSAQPQLPSPRSLSISTERAQLSFPRQSQFRSFPEDNLHEQCMILLRDLDLVVAEFTNLIAENKKRRSPEAAPVNSRVSMDSQGTQEFFDAEGGEGSQLLTIQHETDDEAEPVDNDFPTDDHDSASEIEDDDSLERSMLAGGTAMSLFPSKAKSLNPLPLEPVKRRRSVPSPTITPPSIIGFLRKNVGKDFSTISMPVAANEPISLLQKLSEQLEYSYLLDDAAKHSSTSMERLLYVAAFAVSSQSSLRVKERALRKPFNPMLGETFELVREDRGFRFMAEKISHRPVRMACQAESENWSLTQSPLPTQKFWGKSVELITEGRIRIVLHASGDCFSWTPATVILRNLIAGEKYAEPVGTITITNETTGEKAVVTFKIKGMWSGRSEDVAVELFDSHGDEVPLGLVGKWTQSLAIVENGNPRSPNIWNIGDLVSDATKCYGFTTFTASLNELLERDETKLPPTDSRFRPDQRAAEEGDWDKAELLKAKLEEGQRERRRLMDEEEVEWQPMWFTKADGVEGEEVWKLKSGKESYWEHRAKGDWKGVKNILAV